MCKIFIHICFLYDVKVFITEGTFLLWQTSTVIASHNLSLSPHIYWESIGHPPALFLLLGPSHWFCSLMDHLQLFQTSRNSGRPITSKVVKVYSGSFPHSQFFKHWYINSIIIVHKLVNCLLFVANFRFFPTMNTR